MLKTILCLSACLTLGSTATYAHDDHNPAQFSEEAVEKVVVENAVVTAESSEEVADEVLTEITQTFGRCPHCPRNPNDDTTV